MTALQDGIAYGMRVQLALCAAALLAVATVPTLAQAPGGIADVLVASAAPELVQEGFVFTEGPVGTADGGLYFSDIRVSKVFHLDAGKISMVRENTDGANGLASPPTPLSLGLASRRFISRRARAFIKCARSPRALTAPASELDECS